MAITNIETTPLRELGLRERTHNALLALGIATVGSVAKLTERDLRAADGIGRKGVWDVLYALRRNGLSLAPAQPVDYWANREKKWTCQMVAQLVAYRQTHTLRECAQQYNCSPERIRQIMAKEARRLMRSGMDPSEAYKSVRINL